MTLPVRFDGNVVIVTGAGKPTGLGCAYATALASRGATVVVNDVLDASEVVASIESSGGKALRDGHDISTDDGARGLVQTAVDAFGRLDAVVNNAGFASPSSFPDMTWELFDQALRVHLYGSFFVTKYAWPHLIQSGHGRVVMVSSRSAVWGLSQTSGVPHYAAAKGGLLALTRQLAVEGAPHGICVNAILPTAITSEGHPRIGELAKQLGMDPSDRARVVERSLALAAAVPVWLCHPECTANGDTFKAQAGQAQRLSFALSSGISDVNLSVELARDNFDAIMDLTGAWIVPEFGTEPEVPGPLASNH